MILVNGTPPDTIPVTDRGLQYGDGLFETIAVKEGVPQSLDRHLQRLISDSARLKIALHSTDEIEQEVLSLSKGEDCAVIKVMVTRGSGGRGYRMPAETSITRIVSRHPWPDYPDENQKQGVKVRVCDLRLSSQPLLAGIKHLNRLENILARSEWDDDEIAEGLLRNQQGEFIEGTMSNLFVVKAGVLYTPLLDQCGVAGIMRRRVLELAEQLGISTFQQAIDEQMIMDADELFLTNSIIGIWPIREVVGLQQYNKGKITQQLQTLLEGAE